MNKFFILISVIAFPFFSFSQSNLQYLSSTSGSACYTVHYSNGYLYAGTGNTLNVFDVTGNTPHSLLWSKRLGGNITTIDSRNNSLYVATNHGGLSVWDLSPSANDPQFLYEWIPDSLREAVYDIAFKGSDTVFVACKKKMLVLKDNGTSLSEITRFAHQPADSSLVRGCDVKGNLLAFTSAYGNNSNTGVHIYDAVSLSPVSFYPQIYGDPEDVIFGKNTELLNVLGGTESWQNSDPHGVFYVLNIQNPSLPSLVFSDTLSGTTYFAVAQPIRGENVNDTIYIATNSALNYDNEIPPYGHVFVYDCTDSSGINLITTINQGLWHFDVAINNSRLYVASEWYGLVTMNISNLLSPINLGKTLTGGWNCSADKFGNKLVVANEGYGFKLFDITNKTNPVLVDTNQHQGFNYGISFSADGNHIYAYYYTNNDFRVFNTTTLALEGSYNIYGGLTTVDWWDTQVWQNYAVAIAGPSLSAKKIFITDVTSPSLPVNDTIFDQAFVRDIHVNENGKLFIANYGSIRVFDLITHTMDVDLSLPLQDITAISYWNDTLYVNVKGTFSPGLKKYHYNGGNTLTFVSSTPVSPQDVKYMAADEWGIYLNYQQEGLYARDKNSLAVTGYYKHGMEFYRADQWGQKMLICKDSLIILSEYMAQTSLLTHYDDYITSAEEETQIIAETGLQLFPNPNTGNFTISVPKEFILNNAPVSIKIYDITGREIFQTTFSLLSKQITFSLPGLPAGLYSIQLKTERKIYSGKMLVK
ncbi:MAG: T9SS type A sorting domain-containing protein [Bacteroidota bacterium]